MLPGSQGTLLVKVSMRIILFLIVFLVPLELIADSTCYGTTSKGRLEDSCKLPSVGENFHTYSKLLSTAGRTYVHCSVEQIILSAYESLNSESTSWFFVYGETGKKQGGEFKPHKTHQNGLSVDFMVPVLDEDGRSVPIPTSIFNRYGYDIDFTLDGKYRNLTIDYEAMAAHLAALKRESIKRGFGIWRVIFDPKMQNALKNTKSWSAISDLTFSQRRSWVRHDDHYHVDFEVPCKKL